MVSFTDIVVIFYKKNYKDIENMEYCDVELKKPVESDDYKSVSDFIIKSIEEILEDAIKGGNNKIIINTNLKKGLPMENINKIAGPFVEAWAGELFESISVKDNKWKLIHTESCHRLDMADIILQFQKKSSFGSVVTANVDSKATAEDFEDSGKSPNITSYARIRSAYIEDPDFVFVILSLKHKVFSKKNDNTGLMDGVMEVVKYNAYDIKYLSESDISYNPALGTGQIQIKDIHYVKLTTRNAFDFCQLLDKKFLSSSKRTFSDWYNLAQRNKWIKQ